MVEAAAPLSAVAIERVTHATDDVRALIAALDAELSQHYPPEQRHGLTFDAIFEPHIRFFIARRDGRAAGCGGVALFADFAEVKRMYVRPDMRGHGIAEAIVVRLEAEALAAGSTLMRLETGTQQAAAMRFYRRCGFMTRAAFEPYASMPANTIAGSVFMEKRIET
jgi:putative acetyltransferase